MKRLLACLLGVALACTLSGPASAKTYVNGIDANYPPFSYVGTERQAMRQLTLSTMAATPRAATASAFVRTR